MSRAGWALTTLATAAAAGAGGYWVGQHGVPAPDSLLVHVPALPAWVGKMLPALTQSGLPPTGPVIYYRDPDGKPFYALEPKRKKDGRAYVAVRASEDISFEDRPPNAAPAAEAAAPGGGKRVLYYRNPMGLPDTSPVQARAFPSTRACAVHNPVAIVSSMATGKCDTGPCSSATPLRGARRSRGGQGSGAVEMLSTAPLPA